MPQQRLAFDSVDLSELTAGEYSNLLDLAQLAISHPTADAFFTTLALRLRHSLNFDFVTLGLYDSSRESIHLDAWKAGHAQKRYESIPAYTCASGWAWKNQRPLLVQDLDTEPKLPVFLESLRQLGVRTYYVFPLTTSRHKLGAIGYGSLHVIPKTTATLEFFRRSAAMIAQFLDTTLSSDGLIAQADCAQATSVVTPGREQALQDLDLGDQAGQGETFPEIVGNSAPLQELLRQVRTVASTDATVLLLGETGTGKELVARAVHRLSPRADSKFVSVNCTAIPTELLESELFGHEKGSFTGAINRRIGRLELADRGTLLLDEVGDLPSMIQPKLLRVLQEQEFERLGSNRTHKVDVRVIAATHRDLALMVKQTTFREDLYYRLKVFPITVPALRQRTEDIPELVWHFAELYARRMNKRIDEIPSETMDALVRYRWPGNVRELQNFIERAVILSPRTVLRAPTSELEPFHAHKGLDAPIAGLEEVERDHILRMLEASNWVVGGRNGAAERLGMKRTSLAYRMRKLQINRPVSAGQKSVVENRVP